MSENVDHPNHYISENGMEAINVIEAFTKGIEDPFEAYCTGNIIKYALRWNSKNGVEDLKKAKKYIDFILEHETSKRIENIQKKYKEIYDKIARMEGEIK